MNKWYDYRPVVTVCDVADTGACWDGIVAWVAEHGIIAGKAAHYRDKYILAASRSDDGYYGDGGYGGYYGAGGDGYGTGGTGGGYGDGTGGYGDGDDGYGDGGYGGYYGTGDGGYE